MQEVLSEEQIKKLNEIARLPPQVQQVELQKFLKTLNKEQVEFLMRQQKGGGGAGGAGGGCVFCGIVEGKIASKKVYEDAYVVCALDINPATKGHVLCIPRKHYELSWQMEEKDAGHVFIVANKVGGVLQSVLGAEGTNIFVANGFVAGQNVGHVIVHVIPRYKDDGVRLVWEKKVASEEELDEIVGMLRGKIFFEGKSEVEPQKVEEVDYDEEERMP